MSRARQRIRLGGGLFLPNGSLVGVCVGRVEGDRRGHTRGVFAAPESVRRLLRDHDLDAAVVRSEARRRGEAP